MTFDEFVKAVSERGQGIDTREHARDATETTLRVLGERLTAEEDGDLAAQLPPEIGAYLTAEGAAGTGERFDLDEFYRRVAEREGHDCTPSQARDHALAVMTTVVDLVSQGEVEHLASQLPDDYRELLGAGGTGAVQ